VFLSARPLLCWHECCTAHQELMGDLTGVRDEGGWQHLMSCVQARARGALKVDTHTHIHGLRAGSCPAAGCPTRALALLLGTSASTLSRPAPAGCVVAKSCAREEAGGAEG